MAGLLAARAVRERCHEILEVGVAGGLPHFRVSLERLPAAVDYVAEEVRHNYPTLDVPFHSRWRHFEAGGLDRVGMLAKRSELGGPAGTVEWARVRFDLAVISVLLDAGAGGRWRWQEPGTRRDWSRSEGLALASLALFEAGALSSAPNRPLRADAAGLKALAPATLAEHFQVDASNPLPGLEERVALLNRLGEVIEKQPQRFGGSQPRIGGLFDHLVEQWGQTVPLPDVLRTVLECFADIWPGRLEIGGVKLGDTWRHRSIERADGSNELIPFHKLSQWLTYSLAEPLMDAGIEVPDVDGLTGLAEYRNGGLFFDLGVIALNDPNERLAAKEPGSELVVEWRALTVALLDRIAPLVWERPWPSPGYAAAGGSAARWHLERGAGE